AARRATDADVTRFRSVRARLRDPATTGRSRRPAIEPAGRRPACRATGPGHRVRPEQSGRPVLSRARRAGH
ncbi:hypothetical protein ACWCYC_07020, partial [Streptomyces phaeofaciens]